MKAKVSTKSNYKNLNGKWVEIKEFLGTIISCIVFDEILEKNITVDFNLSEVIEIRNN